MGSLAVIPIVMSAGAAVLPAVVASVVAVVFKPMELLRLCRRRPVTMGGILVGLGVVLGGVVWWAERPALGGARGGEMGTDWVGIAASIIEQQPLHAGGSTGESAGGSAVTNGPDPTFSRTHDYGGGSPAGLVQLWSYSPEQTMFLSTPTVLPGGKRMIVAGCQSDLGGYLGILACVDMETGKKVWETVDVNEEFLKPFFSSPAVTADGKYVVIGSGLHEDRNCALLCFDAATGKQRWAAKTALHVESSPALYNGMAVVGAGAIEGRDGMATGDPGYVFAVRIEDGKELWRAALNDPESSPVIDETGMVYIGSGFNGAAVAAIRSATDEELKAKGLPRIAWKTPVDYPVPGPVTLAGDLILAGGGNSDMVHSNRNARGQVVALDKKSGAIAWKVMFDDAVLGAIAARDGLAICPCRTGEVAGIAVKDGRVLWKTKISGSAPVVSGSALTADRAYVLSGDGYVAALRLTTGDILEKVFVNDKGAPGTGLSMCTPVVAGGRLYVGTETGGMRCYAGKGGAP